MKYQLKYLQITQKALKKFKKYTLSKKCEYSKTFNDNFLVGIYIILWLFIFNYRKIYFVKNKCSLSIPVFPYYFEKHLSKVFSYDTIDKV